MAPSCLDRAHRRAQALVIALLACTVLMLGACSSVQVRTLVAPDANFSGRRTFSLLPPPRTRGDERLGPNDPMLVNSITYRRLHAAIRSALEKRGYQYVEDGASMQVAYYAASKRKLDVRTYDYGYGFRRFPVQRTVAYEYQQGSVVIDIVDPAEHELLWRGQGRARVSTDPDEYAEQLEQAVYAIIDKFPAPTP